MDKYKVGSLIFEWDDIKNMKNIEKHHISFENAANIFSEQERIEFYDDRFDEDRFYTIGKYNDILYVVYTCRYDNIRLISARRATFIERRLYFDRNL